MKRPLGPLIDHVLHIDARSMPYRTERKSLLMTDRRSGHRHVELGGIGDREAVHEAGSAQHRVRHENGDNHNPAGQTEPPPPGRSAGKS